MANYIAEAHNDWHTENGRWGCPWDCAWSDHALHEEPEPREGEGVRCGHCKNRHWNISDVRECSRVHYAS